MFLSILSLPLQLAFVAELVAAACKCTPSDSCWPPPSAWSQLNTTISGRLIQSVPPAAVCYHSRPEYNPKACQVVASQWTNSSFHAADPISIDYPIWANDSCDPVYPNGTSVTGDVNAGSRGCSIGKYPVYTINATEASHVQATLHFAKKWNVRLNVKNTGHSYPGRSTAYGSISIWTHNMKGIQFIEDFQSKSCSSNTTIKQMAATIAAGEQGFDVYQTLAAHHAVVVGGSDPTVGIMGWFTGGGHGPLSSTYGMGADNLLEAVVVTPGGDVVTTNACLEPDLFYALRGGGGGTYAIILQATMKAYPSPQTSAYITQMALTNPSKTKEWWELMAYIHSQLPQLKDGGFQGYYGIYGPPIIPYLAFVAAFYLYDKSNATAVALLAPIQARLNESANFLQIEQTVVSGPDFFTVWKETVTQDMVATGGGAMGSRLLSRRALTENVDLLAQTFADIGPGSKIEGSSVVLLGHMIANSANRGLDIGLNPAWRDAVIHFVIVENWQDGIPQSQIQHVYDDVTYNKTRVLRQLDPDSGAYFNEADPFEPDWQFAFFGKNYPRLRDIKEKYDPNGIMWCRSCVGSEEWIEDASGRLCPVPWVVDLVKQA